MLMKNKNLKTLDISSNRIRDDGVRDVTKAFEQNYALAELRLYNCMISVKGNYS